MSLLPFMYREMIRPLRMLENHMRLVEESFHPMASFPAIRYREPREEASESVVQDKEKFQIKLDVQHFKPQEITVKTVDHSIVVEGKHEEKQDDAGFISRQFVRRFVLPQGHELKNVVSSLSSDGMLTITAPRRVDPAQQERVVPITYTEPEKNEKKE